MTTKQELEALAERVERLTGPDREVDLMIDHAVHGTDLETNPLDYTYSIDAAMALVPEGMFHILWGHRSRSDTRPAATVGNEIGKHEFSLPLALTAAALRARAQEMNDEAD